MPRKIIRRPIRANNEQAPQARPDLDLGWLDWLARHPAAGYNYVQHPLGQAAQGIGGAVPAPIDLNDVNIPLSLSKKPTKTPTRALPNGRMKTVKLGDIIKAYNNNQTTNPYRNRFEIIDFRPVEIGDYFLTKDLCVEKANREFLAKTQYKPKIILKLIKARKQLEDVFADVPQEMEV